MSSAGIQPPVLIFSASAVTALRRSSVGIPARVSFTQGKTLIVILSISGPGLRPAPSLSPPLGTCDPLHLNLAGPDGQNMVDLSISIWS